MPKINRMTDEEVLAELNSDSLLSRARSVYSSVTFKIDQACLEEPPPTPVEMRRMEFEATIKIAAALGIELRPRASGS